MTWDVAMVMNGRGGLPMFFEPFYKSSWRLSYVFFFTPIFTTFVSVYDPTFVGNRIFVLGGHEQVFYGLTSFKVYLYTIFWQVFLILSLSPCWYGTTIYMFLLMAVFCLSAYCMFFWGGMSATWSFYMTCHNSNLKLAFFAIRCLYVWGWVGGGGGKLEQSSLP